MLLAGCNPDKPSTPSVSTHEGPNQKPLYAKGFWFEQYQGHEVLCLQPFMDARDTLRYGLYSTLSAPAFPPNIIPLQIPVKRIVALSATHIGMLDALGAITKVTGVSYPDYIYHPTIHEQIALGNIIDVGIEGGLNKELLIAQQPDLIMATGMSATSYAQDYQVLKEAGIPVWPNAEWLEESVLGRAEWLVAIGALLGKKQEAQEKFAAIDSSYQALKKLTVGIDSKPTVIGGLPYKGVWSIAGGNSYVVKLLQDAGGTWPWANDTSMASLQLDFEAVYPIALEADYWIRVGVMTNKADLLSMDSRFADFSSVKSGQVYNYIHRLAPNGMGNDYWESGVVQPQTILADLIKILHPSLLPNHEYYYYQRL